MAGPGGGDDDSTGANIQYDYFWLANLTGVDGSHVPTEDRIGRSVAGGSGMPIWRGYPSGIY